MFFTFNRSKALTVFLNTTHFASILALLLLPWSFFIITALCALIVFSLYSNLKQHAWLTSQQSITAIRKLDANNHWLLQEKNGKNGIYRLNRKASYQNGFCVLLVFIQGELQGIKKILGWLGQKKLVIVYDILSKENFHKLRLALLEPCKT